ncbi:phosphatase PAP2 family protein [Conyzicola nivalis]|uniref:Phosphatase PAP2 family protein n=1 Tax=Conyzicola nivalis TaxID=1477021 RepID=A0A916SLJ6_9MICO|nr:phosphatase PAP2 family protein [Conyzicola nivalis]GGB05077.1 phosphatase PAP2 family protein [Conyzicola nivalis]
MTDEAPVSDKVARRWPVVSAVIVIVLAVLLGLIIAIRGNLPFEGDAEWMEEIIEHRHPAWEVPSLVMNFLGGGWFAYLLPAAVAIVLCVLRRYWSALFLAVASILSALLVQVLKSLVGRPRPEDMLVTSDFGSFPSGHSANAATLVVCLAIIFRRAWIWVAGVAYVVLMMVSRTYLGAHWVSDTVGGALLGVGAALIVWAPLARKLRLESSG